MTVAFRAPLPYLLTFILVFVRGNITAHLGGLSLLGERSLRISFPVAMCPAVSNDSISQP